MAEELQQTSRLVAKKLQQTAKNFNIMAKERQ
jgi:hypothetical protein